MKLYLLYEFVVSQGDRDILLGIYQRRDNAEIQKSAEQPRINSTNAEIKRVFLSIDPDSEGFEQEYFHLGIVEVETKD